MKLLVLCGDHRRHRYVASSLALHFDVCGIVKMIREPSICLPPEGLRKIDIANFRRHFEDRDLAEKKYFGNPVVPSAPILEAELNSLNSDEILKFIEEQAPDSALVFGTGLLSQGIIARLPRHTVNLHLGLSPRYRGAATLFWPFYFLEPAWAGATFHYLVAEPDAGGIVHQVCPPLFKQDGIHDVGCRTVISATKAAIALFDNLVRGSHWVAKEQRRTGKNFLNKDFRAQHLRVIYNLYDNDVVRAFLEDELPSIRPKLIEQPGCEF